MLTKAIEVKDLVKIQSSSDVRIKLLKIINDDFHCDIN